MYRHFSEPTTGKTRANDPKKARRPKRRQDRENYSAQPAEAPQKTDSHLDGQMETRFPLTKQPKDNTAGPFTPKRLPTCRAGGCQSGGHPAISASAKNH